MTPTMTPAINSTLRRRLLLLAGLIFALWASWKVSNDETPQKAASERTAPWQHRATSKAPPVVPSLPLDWPTRVDQTQPVADLFRLAPPPTTGLPTGLLATPAMPVLNLKYVGRLDGSDNSHVFLADSKDQVITAQVGQAVTDGWQLAAMDSKQLVFRHTATGQEQTMLIGTVQ